MSPVADPPPDESPWQGLAPLVLLGVVCTGLVMQASRLDRENLLGAELFSGVFSVHRFVAFVLQPLLLAELAAVPLPAAGRVAVRRAGVIAGGLVLVLTTVRFFGHDASAAWIGEWLAPAVRRFPSLAGVVLAVAGTWTLAHEGRRAVLGASLLGAGVTIALVEQQAHCACAAVGLAVLLERASVAPPRWAAFVLPVFAALDLWTLGPEDAQPFMALASGSLGAVLALLAARSLFRSGTPALAALTLFPWTAAVFLRALLISLGANVLLNDTLVVTATIHVEAVTLVLAVLAGAWRTGERLGSTRHGAPLLGATVAALTLWSVLEARVGLHGMPLRYVNYIEEMGPLHMTVTGAVAVALLLLAVCFVASRRATSARPRGPSAPAGPGSV